MKLHLMFMVLLSSVCGLAAPERAYSFKIPSAMETLRPGEVQPKGWLRDRCEVARKGYISRLDEVDKAFPRAWNRDFHPRGKYLDWSDPDKGAWCTEGGAYWFEGLVRLAWELDDKELQSYARGRLSPLLERMNPNAIGFVYWMDRRDPSQLDELEKANHGFIVGASGRTTRSLIAYYEATGDERAIQALKWCLDDPRFYFFGNPVTLPAAGCDTWRYCGDGKIADALRNFGEKYPEVQLSKWPALRYGQKVDSKTVLMRERIDHVDKSWDWRLQHGVLSHESLYSFLKLAQWQGDRQLLDNVRSWMEFFESTTKQVHGVSVADEQFGWPGADRGTETCTVAGDLLLYATMAGVTGEGRFGDHVERSFFNAGPVCVSRDWMRHVYFQAPNRTESVGCFHAGPQGKGGVYKPKHWPLCCTAALARILPGYVQWMWMKPSDGGLAAVLYGPCSLKTELQGESVRIDTDTTYPFDENIVMTVRPSKAMSFPLRLRMPEWCSNPEIMVNGKAEKVTDGNGFAKIERTWNDGDQVTIRLPMKPKLERSQDHNNGGKRYCSLSMGPLLFARAVPSEDENTPRKGARTDWMLDPTRVMATVQVGRSKMPKVWEWQEDAPVKLTVTTTDGTRLPLVPYGCARLRISMFPEHIMHDIPVDVETNAQKNAVSCVLPTGAGDFKVELPRNLNGAVVKAVDFGFSITNCMCQVAINQAIEHCRKIGASRLELAPGTYRCYGSNGVLMKDVRDLVVDGMGATLVFLREPGGDPNVRLVNCERVELRNFTMDWDWDVDPLGDLVVVEDKHVGDKEDNSSYIDVRFLGVDRHPVYPRPMAVADMNPMAVMPNGEIRFRDAINGSEGKDLVADLTSTSLGAKSKWLSPCKLRIWPNVRAEIGVRNATWNSNFNPAWNRKCVRDQVSIGASYRLLHYYYGEGGFNMDSNTDLTLRDITVWSCRGHGFCVSGSQKRWQLLNVKLVPPKDVKGCRRVVTATSDGTHVVQSNGYCIYDGCEFRLTNDDTWNFHDVTSPVRRCDARTLRCVSPYGTSRVRAMPGDDVELAEADFTPIAWKGKIVSVANDSFTVDSDLPKGDGTRLLFDRTHSTTHVLIRNCVMEDTHWRGLLYSNDTTVENCIFRRTGGHSLSFEVYYNLQRSAEGSGVTNVVVRGCTFEDGERRINYGDSPTIRSVCTVYPRDKVPKVLHRGTFGQFLIENCKFINPRGMCVKLNAAKDVVFRNNEIDLREFRGNVRYTQGWLGLENVEDVRVENNVWRMSSFMTNEPNVRISGGCQGLAMRGNRKSRAEAKNWNGAYIEGGTCEGKCFYSVGETMTFSLKLGGVKSVPAGDWKFKWKRTGDDGKVEEGVAELPIEKPFVYRTSIDRPGFVRLYAEIEGAGKNVRFDGGAGAEFGKIVQQHGEPEDFDAFWKSQLDELSKIPINPQLSEVKSPRDDVRLYKFSLDCTQGKKSTGFLSIPKKPGKYPVRLYFFGYNESWSPRATAFPTPAQAPNNEIVLRVNAHGLENGREASYYAEARKLAGSNGYGHGFDPVQNALPQTCYFLGMVMRDVRAAQFAKTLPEWDGKKMLVYGGSQGGAQGIWVSALESAITDAEVFIPWMCDWRGKKFGGRQGTDWGPEYASGLDYFDCVNFARRIREDVRMNVFHAGLGDYICPPAGVSSFYNALKCKKRIRWVQNTEHGWSSPAPNKQTVTYGE